MLSTDFSADSDLGVRHTTSDARPLLSKTALDSTEFAAMLHSTEIGHAANRALGHATEATAEHLTGVFHSHARALGWPERVTSSARVKHDGAQYTVDIPEHALDDAMDLEYGTQSTPPAAAIRQFSNRVDEYSGGVFGNAFLDSIGGIL